MKKETFILRTSWYASIRMMDEASKAQFFDALFKHHLDEPFELTHPNALMAWGFVEESLNKNAISYEKAKLNGSKGGAKPGNKNASKKTTENNLKVESETTLGVESKTTKNNLRGSNENNLIDIVIDNVIDIDSVIDTVDDIPNDWENSDEWEEHQRNIMLNELEMELENKEKFDINKLNEKELIDYLKKNK
jgi:hypothetical protein